MTLRDAWNAKMEEFRFKLDRGAIYGPSKPVQEEMARNGWTFRTEAVAALQGGVAVSLHPILNGVEISETKGGRYTPEWERYERERLTAVYKVHNRPLPDVLPVTKAGTLTAMAEFRRRVNHWVAKHEALGQDFDVMKKMESQGWKFRRETVDAVLPPAMPVDVFRPITPEGRELKPGSDPEWPRYEAARMAAVEQLFGKQAPAPDIQ